MLVCSAKLYFLSVLSNFLMSVSGNPLHLATDTNSDDILENSNSNITEYVLDDMPDCKHEELHDAKDNVFLNNADMFLKSLNITVHSSDYHQIGDSVLVCLDKYINRNRNDLMVNYCKDRFVYNSHEFQILPNRSALVFGDIIEPNDYKLQDGKLLICADDDPESEGSPRGFSMHDASIYVGQIGSAISIVALVVHLLTFFFLPTLRNLPGCNLASLSVAFIFGYSFVLIGQIPEVLGLFCVLSGIFQQNFFLVAFFCMNVLAFDVWRSLKMATEKLIVGSNSVRKRQFVWYSLYAWGFPLVITTVSVVLDNVDGVPDKIKPYFGKDDTCWMTNNFAKTIFFAVPAFTLFLINAIFFIRSSMMISNNTMKSNNDQQKQNVKLNYVLYVRLGLMMGLTWIIGVIAMISKSDIVWFIHDIFNSLQGLFLFLLFTCTKKVVKLLKESTRLKKFSSTWEKHSTSTTKMDSNTSS